jgi:putative membrane protein
MKARNLLMVVAVCGGSLVVSAEPAKLGGTDAKIVAYLHASDRLEIDLGNLAKRNGSPEMQVFGATLVDDHTNADKLIVAFARKHGMTTIPVDAPIDSDHRPAAEAESRLRSLKGADFDKAFLEVVPDAEDAEVQAVEQGLAASVDPELDKILRTIEPQLKSHVTQAQNLKR